MSQIFDPADPAGAAGASLGPRTRVAVLFGGRGSEHTISCASAASVVRHLPRERYEVTPVRIDRDGCWIIGVDRRGADIDPERLLEAGLTVAGSVVLHAHQESVGPADRRRLGLPVFVKPARAGSSAGVSRVDDWAGLEPAVAAARTRGHKVLVEAAVPGREVDIGLLQFPDGRIVAGPPLEYPDLLDALVQTALVLHGVVGQEPPVDQQAVR